MLEAPFSEEEVKKAIFGSYSDGAPGPDGLPFLILPTFLGYSEMTLWLCFWISTMAI